MDTLNLRQRILLNQPHIESVKDNLVNFDTDMKAPLKECKVYFEPIQEGEGDPSPDNVRNIIGWDGMTVNATGKNLRGGIDLANDIKERIPSATIDTEEKTVSWRYDAVHNSTVYVPKVPFKENTRYTFIVTVQNALKRLNFRIYYTDGSVQALPDLTTTEKLTLAIVTTANKTVRTIVRQAQGGTTKLYYDESGFFEGVLTTDDFEPFGQVIPISWQIEAGTVYGGYVDLIKGELVAEWVKFVFDRNSTVSSSGTSTLIEGLTWMTLRKTISSTLPYKSTPNSGDSYGFFTIGDWQKAAVAGKNRAFVNSKNLDVVLTSINNEDLTTSEGRSTFFDYIENNEIPIECVYKLATPIHYQLTPQQLFTLKGTNNIWSNSNGQTEVKFWTH